jgi:hypothetical protein
MFTTLGMIPVDGAALLSTVVEWGLYGTFLLISHCVFCHSIYVEVACRYFVAAKNRD